MGFGDEILAAGQAQRIYEANPWLRVAIMDRHLKPRWHPIWDGNPIIARPEEIAKGEPVQTIQNGPDIRPYYIPPFTRHSGWKFNPAFKARDHIAKIYLTRAELSLGVETKATYGPYVLIEPWSKHENLRWPLMHWEALVDSRRDLTFVQHVHADSTRLPGVVHVPATFRQACGLLAEATVYIRGESGMLHAAAALGKPAIAIWGGCMDWEVLGNYPTHVGVGITGPACGRWLPCPHCTDLMHKISVQEVLSALDKFA